MQLAETIKATIEAKLCPVHDIHADVEITDEFQVICCCTAFHDECKHEIEALLADMDVTLNLNIV